MKDRVLRVFGVMRQNMSSPDYRALDREWQPRLAAARRRDPVYAGAVRTDRCRVPVAATVGRSAPSRLDWSRVSGTSSCASGARLAAGRSRAPVRDQPGARGAVRGLPRQGPRRREHLDAADRRARPGGLARRRWCRRRPKPRANGGSTGWAILNTRSSVDPFLTFSRAPRSARDGVEALQVARRQRRRQRHQRRPSPASCDCAPSARACSAIASHAHWQMADSMAAIPERARGAADAGVAGRRRPRPRRSGRHAGDRRRRGRAALHDRAVGLPLLRRAGARRRNTTSTSRSSARTSSSDSMVAGRALVGRAALRHRVHGNHRHACRCFIPTSASGRSSTCRRARTAACSISTPSPAPASGPARGRRSYRTQHRHGRRRHRHRVEQQQLPEGRAGRAGARLARRRADAVPRVRALAARAAAGHHVSELCRARRATSSSCRRRSTSSGCSRASCSTASRATTRPASRCRSALIEKVEASETFNQGYKTVETVSAAILDLELHTPRRRRVRPAGVRARDAGADRHAARDRAAPPPAALRSPVRQRRYSGRLLQLPVGRRDGGRRLAGVSRRPADRGTARSPARFRTHILSDGNTHRPRGGVSPLSRSRPEVRALLARRADCVVTDDTAAVSCVRAA